MAASEKASAPLDWIPVEAKRGSDQMISIVVPAYNAENTIERCVESILCQQYPCKEIILVNDGSKDGTLDILRRMEAQHREITVIDKPNGGVSSARNAGLRICTGKYVTFIDSDDYYLSDDYIAGMAALLDEHENVDLAVSGYTVLTGNEKTPVQSGKHMQDMKTLATQYWQYSQEGLLNAPWNKMFRYSLIREAFPEDMRMGEDTVFVLRYMKNCRSIIFDDNCGYGYVCENSSTTAGFRKSVAYDMKQSAVYHGALHDFWECFLPPQLLAENYIEMRTDEVLLMLRALLFKKGIRVYMERAITEVIADERFIEYYPAVAGRFDGHPHKKLMNAVAAVSTAQVKRYCLCDTAKGIIRARLGK